MSLEKRTGSPFWYARFQIGGRRYFFSSGTANKREAAAFERTERARLQAEHQAGEKAKREPMTVAAAMGRYWHESGQYQKGGDVLRHLHWLEERLGKRTRIDAITAREVAAIAAQRRADGVSNATVNRSVIEPLRRVMRRARTIWAEAVQDIPWGMLKLPEAKERIREASFEEEARVIAATREEYRAPVQFAIITGFRLSEVANLKRADIDWQARKIFVMRKGDKPTTIPLTDDAAEIIRPLLGLHPEFVFTYERRRNRGGKKGERAPILAQTLGEQFRAACKRAGVTGLRFHDLRHTTGSRVTRAGGLRVAKELLGHEDIKSTMRYAHVLDGDIRSAMETASQNRINAQASAENESKNKNLG